jgi:hypothetical protein
VTKPLQISRRISKVPDQALKEWDNCKLWVYHSSGQLCAELIPPSDPGSDVPVLYWEEILRMRVFSASNAEDMVVESLTMGEYHYICFNLAQYRNITISPSMTVNLGIIFSFSSGHPLEDSVEIAYMPNVGTHIFGWQTSEEAEGVVMEDGEMLTIGLAVK